MTLRTLSMMDLLELCRLTHRVLAREWPESHEPPSLDTWVELVADATSTARGAYFLRRSDFKVDVVVEPATPPPPEALPPEA